MQSKLSPEEFLAQWLSGDGQIRLDQAPDQETRELAELADSIDQWHVPAQRTKVAAWDLLNEKLTAEVAQAVPTASSTPFSHTASDVAVVRPMWQRTWARWSSVAAVVLVLVGAWYIMREPTLEVLTADQGQQIADYSLPDGSTVSLNAGSSLRFNPATWQKNRTVQLEGEGFFSVEKGSTFTVETSQGDITVLGTSFNVFSRKSDLQVVCYTGKVQVDVNQTGTQESVTLTPGMFVTAESGTVAEGEISEIVEGPAWMVGNFFFRNAPLEDVFEEISRQFNVEIQLETTVNEHYSGSFRNDTLNSALKEVAESMGLAIFEEQGVYHIRDQR